MVDVRTTLAQFRSQAAIASAGDRVPLVATVEVDGPWSAYRRARSTEEWGVFLETGGGASGRGYFGVAPTATRTVDTGALSTIRSLGHSTSLVRGSCGVPFPGGWFGWLSYDVAREIESLPDSTVDDRGLPLLQLARYETIATWEAPWSETPGSLELVTAPRVGGEETGTPTDIYERGVERLRTLETRIRDGSPAVSEPEISPAPFESDCGRAAFTDRVRTIKQAIRDGDTFQANISQRLTAPAAVHPVTAYEALRSVNPAPYAALVEFPGVDLVSASPELLLERHGARLETEPIAGTRPRGTDEAADEALADDLATDEKERAEHAMLVDLERNDLGKVANYGTVEVPEYRRIDRYSEVMHLVSRVTGELRPAADLADAIAAVFPGGTITGAPKPETMTLIERVEGTRRGPYTGSIAALGFDGRAILNIIIRTLVRHGDAYHLRVGAGIVHDSEPDLEFEETMDKARALVRALSAASEADLAVVEE
ncbi:MAG: aminodeoxychorismate synthase, component I [Halobacteriaceae archaeon]